MRFTSALSALALAALAASGADAFNAKKQRGGELLSPLGDKEVGSLGDYSKITPNLQNSKTPGSESKTRSASLRLCVERNAWTLPPKGARIEGSTLVVELSPGDPTNAVHCEAPLDLTGLLGDGTGLNLTIRVRAEGVTKPAHRWNGVKFMLRYEDADTGKTHYPGASIPIGTYGWRTVTNRVNILTAPVNPVGGRATLVLGLQESTGRVEFDLDSLRIATEDVGVSRVNKDWIVRYPGDEDFNAEAQRRRDRRELLSPLGDKEIGSLGEYSQKSPNLQNSKTPGSESNTNTASLPLCVNKPLRGCMLPAKATTEDDIETLHQWGATMARFQIMRRFLSVEDNQDLPEYWAWIDKRLDNLENVLKWAQARGMKICVDLHSFPGGLRASDRDSNMLHDEKWAAAFVETWRRIARRFNGHPALYGYDLVNEPKQISFAPISYWEIQRRAAEAIREIDPVTPIVVESNMAASPGAFRYLSPLAMDNVIYQCHIYGPQPFTHQGVATNARKHNGKIPFWPDPSKGWDRDYIRERVKAVRVFQEKHKCRIYVGEFSAVGYAPGADQWIRDAISVFEEFGWDWTYHAFREWPGWSVEHEAENPDAEHPDKYRRVSDSPRKRALLEGFQR